MKSETRSIDGPADFELSLPRTRPLSYTVSTPEDGVCKGLVFVIPGFGGDASADYSQALRRHIAEAHGMAAVSVDYHCIVARPDNGAGLRVHLKDHFMLAGVAAHHGLAVENYGDLSELTEKLVGIGFPLEAYAEILPGGEEYQNFGVLQAMDHLTVLADLLDRGPAFDTQKIVALGSSHGGYIAHMIAKIAPNTLSLIIDNSSYVQPPMNYLAIGENGEWRTDYGGVTLVGRVKCGWTVNNRNLANFYSRDADLIRDMAHPPHLAISHQAATGAGTRYAMVNSAEDGISPPRVKRRQAAAMSAAGMDARLEIIDQSGIDGRLFKALTHGLDASLKGLFDLKIALLAAREGALDCETGATVVYPCVDKGYRFTHGPHGVTGDTFELYPLDDEAGGKAAA